MNSRKLTILMAVAVFSMGSVGCKKRTVINNAAPAAPVVGPINVSLPAAPSTSSTAPTPVSTVAGTSVIASTPTTVSKAEGIVTTASLPPTVFATGAPPSVTGSADSAMPIINIVNVAIATALDSDRRPLFDAGLLPPLSVAGLRAATMSDSFILTQRDGGFAIEPVVSPALTPDLAPAQPTPLTTK